MKTYLCDTDACTEHGIQGYPTLLLFGNGDPIDYSGDRSLMSLLNFVKTNAGPAVKQVDATELSKYISTGEVSLAYLSNSKEIPEIIERAAKKYVNTVSFYSTQDPKAFKSYNLGSYDLPIVIILKDGKHKLFTHDLKDTESNEKRLFDWIEGEQYPLVSRLNPSNYLAILQGDRPVVLNIVNNNDAVSRAKFHAMATSWDNLGQGSGTVFAEMDRAVWGDYVRDNFKVEYSSDSKVIIYNTEKSEYFTKDVNGKELSSENPGNVYLVLENLDKLRGVSALSTHKKLFKAIGKGLGAISNHWLISLIVFSLVGTYYYKHSQNRSKKPYVLPSHKD
ncbi:unnamed protein product [Rhizopus stolonifer]